MIDNFMRRMLDRPLTRVAGVLNMSWVTPNRLTLAGLVLGLASAVLAANQWWAMAVAAWLVSRLFDGLDGALARVRRASVDKRPGEAGGFLDIVADFIVYGATVFGVAVGAADGFGAPWWPFMFVLVAYYVNGTAFLAFSSIAERTGRQIDDGRSLSFLGRIAEGTETILVHSLWLIVPAFAWQTAVLWGVFVALSATQRIIVGFRILNRPASPGPVGSPRTSVP
ncbi:phosphatidylglycerophosphate synthase [Mycetocola sp. CAN_C7]|uniref:CDP-alcohol phosphatidyltransferase family protein n=1 Tax=Mycetocola sp. CAN_C7 TaxID=2787724 RepID=UPI0018C8F987